MAAGGSGWGLGKGREAHQVPPAHPSAEPQRAGGPQSDHHPEGQGSLELIPMLQTKLPAGTLTFPAAKKPPAGSHRYPGQCPVGVTRRGWGGEGLASGREEPKPTGANMQACGVHWAAECPALCIPVTRLRPCHPCSPPALPHPCHT